MVHGAVPLVSGLALGLAVFLTGSESVLMASGRVGLQAAKRLLSTRA